MNFRARMSAFKNMHSRIPGPLSENEELWCFRCCYPEYAGDLKHHDYHRTSLR